MQLAPNQQHNNELHVACRKADEVTSSGIFPGNKGIYLCG